MKTLSDLVRERISFYLGKQNITQYRLAELSGIPFSTIKSIMQKKTKGISFKTIILLANGFNVPLNEFADEKIFNLENIKLD